jgi:hypothetical protein
MPRRKTRTKKVVLNQKRLISKGKSLIGVSRIEKTG